MQLEDSFLLHPSTLSLLAVLVKVARKTMFVYKNEGEREEKKLRVEIKNYDDGM